jgi:adenosylhomocysteine nucleosidase
VNFGVVGGLTEEMAQTKTCVVERVVHYDFDTSAYDKCLPGQYMGYPDEYLHPSPELIDRAVAICPELKRVTCASADKFVDGAAEKSALHARWGADICEMEAAAVVLTCDRSGVPCLLIKTVSDGLTQGGEDFGTALGHTSALCLEVADQIIREL